MTAQDETVARRTPTRVGPYEILEQAGAGGMGVVYRGRHLETGAMAAVKTVELTARKYLTGIRREIQALSRLRHPSIVRIVDSGVDDQQPWYAMELLEGQTLGDVKRRLWSSDEAVNPADTTAAARSTETLVESEPSRSSPTAERAPSLVSGASSALGHDLQRRDVACGELPWALTIVRRLCDPLAYLHGEGLVHRDLKPDNVFLVDQRPVLVDFGLASQFAVGGREVLEIGGWVEGTVGYMAPEQLRGELVDARADLYALGCVLYELLTGRRPFRGAAAFAAYLHEDPTPPSHLVEGVPDALDLLVERLLAKRPQERFGHADDVSAALEELGAEGGAPQGPPPRSYLYRPGLAGRAEALQALTGRLDALVRRQPGHVFVGGSSGVGKTRLVVELARLARMRGMRVIVSECPRLDAGAHEAAPSTPSGTPLAAFRPLLRAIADLCREGGAAATRTLLGERQPVLATYEPSLASVPHDDDWPEPPRLPTEAVRLRLLTYLGETLMVFAEDRPLVLIVDDLQWADELSLSFLGLLTTGFFGVAPLLVVGTYRSDEVPASLDEILAFDSDARLALGVLDDAAVRELVRDMMASPKPPRGLVQFLTQRSGGNPFFVAEYLRAALGEGLLRRDRLGRWTVSEKAGAGAFEAMGLPGTLQDLVARRLASLADEALQVLEAAAVLGRSAAWELLARVAQLDELTALDGADRLRLAQVLEEVDGESWRFVHDQLRETAYARLTDERRTVLHARAARALEDRHAGSPELAALAGTLAYHWRLAGDRERTIVYLGRAGAHALATGAYGEAAAALRQALALDEEPPVSGGEASAQRANWHRQLGEALFATGQLAESRVHLQHAVALLGFPAPTARLGLTVDMLGQGVRQLLRGRRAIPQGQGLEPDERRRLLDASSAYERLMGIGYFFNDTGQMFDAALRHLNLAERAGPSGELARAYGSMAGIAGLVPWHRLAESYAARALAVGEAVDEPHAMIWVHQMVACYRLGLADWERTREHFEAGRALADHVAARRDWEQSTGGLCTLAFLRGRLDEALAFADEQLESARRGDAQVECFGRLHRAQALLMRGELAAAALELRWTQPLLEEAGLGRPERIWHGALLARLRLLEGDREAALAAADVACELIAKGPPVVWYCIHAYGLCAEVQLAGAAGREPAAKARLRAARQAVATVQRCARVMRPAAPAALRLAGELALVRGRAKRAQAAWQRALLEANALDMPLDAARVHLAMGLPGRGLPTDDAHEHLRLAATLAEDHAASGLAESAREALGA